jgi:hypothetical protein
MYFVYRSWYEGPLGKLTRHFPGTTVLDWFRGAWAEEWVRRELGARRRPSISAGRPARARRT